MSFWDRLGDAYDATAGKARAGLSWYSAMKGEREQSHDAIAWLNDQVDKVVDPLSKVTFDAVGKAGQAIDTVYSYGIARPVSTAVQVDELGRSKAKGSLTGLIQGAFDKDSWAQAWKRSEEISPGQAITTAFTSDESLQARGLNPADPFAQDKGSVAARYKWFQSGDSWSGKLASGSIDFAGNVFADPTMLVAKAGKAASLSSRTLKGAEETTAALAAAGGATDVTGRQARLGGKISEAIRRTDGMSASEIALQPEFRATGDSNALAYAFARANEVHAEDEVARHATKRAVWGAMLGDKNSIDSLKQYHEGLANEIKRMGEAPPQSAFDAQREISDHGAAALQVYNAETPYEIIAQRKLIDDEMARLERIVASAGTSSLVRGDSRATASALRDMSGISTSYLNSGLGNRPVRIVAGALGSRLPGHVQVKDPVVGFEQLRSTLTQATLMEPATRKNLLDRYISAVSAGDRQGIVREAEARVVASVGKRYDLSPEAVQRLIESGDGTRNTYMTMLKTRLYSAAEDDRFVHLVDPENDEAYAVARPLLQSQIEDNVPIVDPRQLERAVRELSGNRTWEKALNSVGASNAVKAIDGVNGVADDVLRTVTRVWKDAALMRFAYPARVQVDSQLRLMTHIGVLPYMAQFPQIAKGMTKYLRSNADLSDPKMRNWFKPGDYEAGMTEMLTKAGVPEEDIAATVRKLVDIDGNAADLAGEMADRGLGKARMEGNFGYVDPADKMWAVSWQRAVNRQIRNSPTAMKAAEGYTIAELRRFVTTDKVGRAEWRELAGSNGNDIDGWLATVQNHVNHYLPTQEMRAKALAGDIQNEDVVRWFGGTNVAPGKPGVGRGDRTSRSNLPGDVSGPGGDGIVSDGQAARMRVHGESYSPLTKSKAAEAYEKTRTKWYEFASGAPEAVMARSPLYADSYKRNMAEIVARLGDNLSSEDLMNARRAADRAARKDVGKVLFDSSHSSNLSQSMRYVSPFFAAWEDMMKKWSGLIYDKPWTAVRIDQIWDSPNAAGVVVDSNGNRVDEEGNTWLKQPDGQWKKLDPTKDAALIGDGQYMLLPAGPLGKLTGQSKFRINKNAFNIVFQGEPWWLPGAGPLVQVGVNDLIRSYFPEHADDPLIKFVLPFGPTDASAGEQMLPSWIKQARSAFGNTQDHANTYALLLAQETSLVQAGKRGPIKPGEIADKTRNWYIVRAITANASPVSMQPSAKLQFYVDQAHIYRQQYGKEWQTKFSEDFPEYFDMSLSLSSNPTGIVATEKAYNALKDSKIRQAVSENPDLGWMLVGPENLYGTGAGTEFSQGVYTWQQTSGLGFGNETKFRGKQSPQEALAKVEASKGWIMYQKVRTLLNEEMAARGVTSLEQKGAEDLKGRWSAFVKGLSENDSWRRDYEQRDVGKVTNLLTVASREMKKNPKLAQRADMKSIATYIEARAFLQEQLAKRDNKSLAKNPDLQGAWNAFTAGLVKNNIGFEQVYNRILEADTIQGEVLS